MKKSRFTEEQIIGILKEAEAGQQVHETCRKHGISEWAFYQLGECLILMDASNECAEGWDTYSAEKLCKARCRP